MPAQTDSKHSSLNEPDERSYAVDPIELPSDPSPAVHEKERDSFSDTASLADRTTAYHVQHGPITDALVNFFRISRKHHDTSALDDIATQPSVYDGPQAAHYQPRADWENIEAFDPSFRWTWREEQRVLRKVDWRVLAWVCVMFFALDIDRYNVANGALSRNVPGWTEETLTKQPPPTTF
jgi:hypothetical protein